jgi:RNA polymerase sigma-70 factor, ECF subfamily
MTTIEPNRGTAADPMSQARPLVAPRGQMDLDEPGVHALLRSVREPEAFARFYDQHAARLLAYLAKRVYDAEVALDLTAEAFAQGYFARRRFRGTTDGEAKAWLYAIANRQLARYFRKGKAERRALERLGVQLPSLDEDERSRIEELADLDGLRVELRRELEQLSRAERDALELRVVEELPYAEVASRLGISEHAARARVCRGLKALAAALDRSPLMKEIAT